LVGFVAIGEMATSGARGVLVVTAIGYQLRRWEVLDIDNALRRVWHVFTRSKHGRLPLGKKVGTGSIEATDCFVYIDPRIPATVSTTFNEVRKECLMTGQKP
jgi:hypothetical protein